MARAIWKGAEREKGEAAPARTAKVIDLAALLQQSLEEGRKAGGKAPHRRATSSESGKAPVNRRRATAHRKRA